MSRINVGFFLSTFAVAPDTINNHVKTCREEQKCLHFFAPEYGGNGPFSTLGCSKTSMLIWSLVCKMSCKLKALLYTFSSSCCQRHHCCGHLFLWNVRFRGERHLLFTSGAGRAFVCPLFYFDLSVDRWLCWKLVTESHRMCHRKPLTMPSSPWRTPCRE